MIRSRFLAALALTGLLLMIQATASIGLRFETNPPSQATAAITEDSPAFEWSTMGNMERGVVVKRRAIHVGRQTMPNPLHRVVNACEYAYLAHEGLLSRKTKHLRGDGIAMRHGCDYKYFG